MAKNVQIDGVGEIEFPDSMSDDEISAAIQRDVIPRAAMGQQQRTTYRIRTRLLDRLNLTGAEVKRRAAEAEPVLQEGEGLRRVDARAQLGPAILAGAAEGVGGAVGLVGDVVSAPMRSFVAAVRARQAGGSLLDAQKAGASEAASLPVAHVATEAADDLQRRAEGALGVEGGASGPLPDVARFAANVLMPGPEAVLAARQVRGAARAATDLETAAGVRELESWHAASEASSPKVDAGNASQAVSEPAGAAKLAGDADVRPNATGSAAPTPAAAPTNPDAVRKVTDAIKAARPLRKEQDAIYRAGRRERIQQSVAAREGTSGEAGFRTEMGPLAGEHPKVEFQSIREQVGQDDIDSLFNTVRDYEGISDFEKIRARQGLAKLFGEGENGGRVPQKSELALLRKVFGGDFADAAERGSLGSRAWKTMLDYLNVPRSIMSSFDLSAPLRQGIFFATRPKQWGPAFREMFKYAASEKAYEGLEASLRQRPTFELMNDSGLAITDLSSSIGSREEQFASNAAERIPGIGRVVRASGRAYTGFLVKLRADVFDDLVSRATKLGLDVEGDDKLARSIAGFVNAGTGRGNFKSAIGGAVQGTPHAVGSAAEEAKDLLNAFFFSPRLIASRMTLLNPAYYVRQPAFVRKEALKSMLAFAGAATGVASLAGLAGANVETDARSSDFGKIRVRNTRFDPYGGFQQYVRMAAQLGSGEYKSATGGAVRQLGVGYKAMTRYDILLRQAESKEAPIASFITDILRQQDYRGKPVDVPMEVADRFTPMVISDLYELGQEDPALLPLGSLSVFGVGVQTFKRGSKRRNVIIDAARKVSGKK